MGKTYGLPYVISNCSNNYGPFQNTEKFIPQIIIKALNGEQIPIYGAGDQVRDWLYVDDHVRAIEKVAIKGNRYNTYNIEVIAKKLIFKLQILFVNYLIS